MEQDSTTEVAAYLTRRLEHAEELLATQGRTIEALLEAARTEIEEPGSVDWEEVLNEYCCEGVT